MEKKAVKITITKRNLEDLVKEEIENVIFEQKNKKTATKVPKGWLVIKQEDGNVYPIIQKFWDRKTRQVMEAIQELNEAQGGSWYQSKSSDAEDYEAAYQEFMKMKWFWETFTKINNKRKKKFARVHKPLLKWSFEENYGKGDPSVLESHPNYITKIIVEKSDIIKGGVNPTIYFSDGSKKQFKTPSRKITAANASRKAWENSVLVFNGEELSWHLGGLGGEEMDSSDPVGGPWKAGSGTVGDHGDFLNWFRGLDRGAEQQKWNREQAESDGRAGPIPEGWYHVGSGRGMELVPKKLIGDTSDKAVSEFSRLYDQLKPRLKKKWNQGRQNKALLKWERIWRNLAWGQIRMAISNRGKAADGKRVVNMSTIYGRGGFYVHGGSDRYSSGCIDLAEDMPKFHEFWVKKWIEAGAPSKKVSLYVNYREKDMKKISKLISQSGFRNKETESVKDSPGAPAVSGDSGWNIPQEHMKKITGCRGGSPVHHSLKWSSKEFYDTVEKIVPSEILSQGIFKGWNVGNPGKLSRLLVAMIQKKLFDGDLKQVDGCFGQNTYKKWQEKGES